MKKLLFVLAVALTFASCGSGASTEETAPAADSTACCKADSSVVVDTTAVDTVKTK